MFKNKSINQITKITVVFTAIVTLFITFLLFLNTYNEHQTELKKIEDNYLKSQKEHIKIETQRALRYIAYKQRTSKKNITELQADIVDTIENMRDIRNGSGYIFIYTFDGINIADPILTKNAGKNLLKFKDPNGKLVIKELIDVSKNENGGFINYVWNKPTTNKLTNKISYAISFKPWRWMIGTGVYLDDIENVLLQKKQEYRDKILIYILQISLFTLILFVSSIVVSRYFTVLITKDINEIKDILKNVSDSYKIIDIKKLHFKEFKHISKNINLMIEELKELNLNLEQKVNIRTVELKQSEQFALKLVEDQDKFIKNAIHEINTPLSIIITNIDLFKMKFSENKYLSKIEAGSKIIHNIYNDLGYLIKKDRIKYEQEKINFSKYLYTRIDFFNEVALGNLLKLEYNIEEDVFINFNETQLQRICDNSLSNAIKYSYENSDIMITLVKNVDTVILNIQNHGDTIENSNKLFERFYRENSARGGFGIGLNIVEDICTNNNVDIQVTSINNVTNFIYTFTVEKI